MATLNVGGLNPIRRYKTFVEALQKAKPDDTIQINKNEKISTVIEKHLVIDGKGKKVTMEAGKAGLIFNVPAIVKNIHFIVESRSNALVLRKGGILDNVTIEFDKPIHELYPAILHESGKLEIKNSNIQKLSTYEGTSTVIKDSTITDYYNGLYEFMYDENASNLNGNVQIDNCQINSTVFTGRVTITNSIIGQFNKLLQNSNMSLINPEFKHLEIKKTFNEKKEPEHGPLKNSNDTNKYLLNSEGSLNIENYTSEETDDFVAIFATGGFVEVKDTNNHHDAYHIIRNASIGFNHTIDKAYYEIENSVVSQVQSKVNTSKKTKSAMEKLNELVGLNSVKQSIKNITNTIQMNQANPNDDFAFSYHMIFAGDPGTGKTTVGKIVAQALFEIGAVPENKLTEVTVDKLIKGYIGQTASNVREILDEARGGVLFIDEAYELTVKDNEKSFNSEALSVIIRYMEDYRDDLVVIAAGYTKEMREFLASNIGLQRRFQWVDFEDYTISELTGIFELMRTSHGKEYQSEKLQSLIPKLFDKLTGIYLSRPDSRGRVTNGGNGGLVRNAYQQVVQVQNNRIISGENTNPNIIQEDLIQGFRAEMEKAIQT